MREMSTICTVLDCLAHNKAGSAADVLAQRLRALELSATRGWERASKLELVPNDHASLVGQDMELGASRDVLLERRLEKREWQNSKGDWPRGGKGRSTPGTRRARGKEKGKDKGKKGKDDGEA